MNRNEMLLYLENLRNLETLKYCCINKMNDCDIKILEAEEKLKEKHVQLEPKEIVTIIMFVVLLCFAIAAFGFSFVYAVGTYNRFLLFCMRYALPIILITVAIVAPSPFGTIFGVFSTLSAKNMANRYNRNVDTIKPIVLREIEQIKSEENQFISEVNEVNQLLSEAYAFNLIPLQFRKLPYVIYIYEYMATSKQSLEAAMLHSHIEEAVQQITEKLDKIIEQNMEMIRMLRYNLATSSSIVSRLEAVSNDIRLNNHLINVNNYYLHTKLL